MANDEHNKHHGSMPASEAGQKGGDTAAKRQGKGRYGDNSDTNNT